MNLTFPMKLEDTVPLQCSLCYETRRSEDSEPFWHINYIK